jgi:hypothetical protein
MVPKIRSEGSVASRDILGKLVMEGPGAGEAGVYIHPKAHRHKVGARNRTRRFVKKHPMLLVENRPDPDFCKNNLCSNYLSQIVVHL